MFKCGIDIVEISRIKKAIETNDKFIERIFTDSEILYSESKKSLRYESYAARFAAKEAVYKAISENIQSGDFMWKSIEIVNTNCGKPKVKIYMKVEDLKEIDVSLSHSKEYAIAQVIAVFIDKE